VDRGAVRTASRRPGPEFASVPAPALLELAALSTRRSLVIGRFRLAPVLALSAFCATSPLTAVEVPGFRPDPSLRPARAPEPAPLRLAQSLSLEPLARLEPAATAARAELAAMAANNRDPRRPHQVGFGRVLAEPLALAVQPERLASAIGQRVGGGFLARERSGNWIWGTSVEVAGARALRLELSEVNLPVDSRLWVYGTNDEARAFDLRRLAAGRTLFSPVIEGDRIHLEVELPDGALASGQGFEIRRVHELVRSRGTLQTFAPEADSCLQNGECFDASDFPGIEIARDGVVQYFFTSGGLTYVCSAGLLNDNVASTLEPWLLTANHCVSTQSEALSIDSAFFYRYNSCGGGGSTYSLGPQGADLIVTSESTDVTLLRATDADEIPPGAYYLGWTSIRPADGTILHRLSHPVRESDSTLLPQIYSSHQLDETPAFVCSGAPATHFLHSLNTGGTGMSGGSSGSPVMRSDGHVVGQLLGSCGDDPDGCGTDENVLDGALATSYPLLRPYLSPEGNVCIRDADTACLLDGRFKVEVTWQTASGSGDAQVMYFNAERAESVESAFFWFFAPTNFEMGVKMVDACAGFNRVWVFFSALTSQGFQVTVTRMSDGLPKVYPANPINNIPTTVADTDAFPCS
jgi:hypothetical protein